MATAELIAVLGTEVGNAAKAELGVELDRLAMVTGRRKPPAGCRLAYEERRERRTHGHCDAEGAAVRAQRPHPSPSLPLRGDLPSGSSPRRPGPRLNSDPAENVSPGGAGRDPSGATGRLRALWTVPTYRFAILFV